jgi:ankyrin repeat protein
MRRACDRRDTIIMDYLLRMDLSAETVNRPASTSRETPLKIAIEMADAAAVERLVALGANVEHASDYVPTALVYALSLMYSSLHRGDMTQQRAYLEGRTRADVHDAKDGAVLDIQLASRRMELARLREASPIYEELFEHFMEWQLRPPEACRRVVTTLLRLGADPNRRYRVEHEHLAEWTPTLFGAQLGDLEVFRALLKHGGDPDSTLMVSSSLDRQDALWVAVSHGRHAIVNELMRRGR